MKLFSPFSSSYQNKSKHPLMIVPAPIPRSENLLAEFARFSTHIQNIKVMTSSHVCKLMQLNDMTVCACVICDVRVEGMNIWGKSTCHTLSIRHAISTITEPIQLACLESHDSLHMQTDLQFLVSVLIATVSLNMRGDRGCLFTHEVQTIVGIRKETMLQNTGSVLRISASLTARML